jgi:transposase-like protein
VPLVDLSMVEQRYDAVREVLDGATVKDTATRYGVDRRTLHRWLVRYATGGLAALADRSSTPDPSPDGAGDRGTDRRDEKEPSRLGPAHDPQQAAPRPRGPAVASSDLSLPRATPADPTQTPSTPARRLQALGEIALHGTVADRRDGKRPSRIGFAATGRDRGR